MINQSLFSTTQLIKYITLWYHQSKASKNHTHPLLFSPYKKIPAKEEKKKRKALPLAQRFAIATFGSWEAIFFLSRNAWAKFLAIVGTKKRYRIMSKKTGEDDWVWSENWEMRNGASSIYKHLKWMNERKWFWRIEAQIVWLVRESLMVFQNSSVSQSLVFLLFSIWFLL